MDQRPEEEHEDVVYEPEETGVDGFGRSKKEKDLREKLKECQKEKQEYLQGWQRTKADLINQNKQSQEERKKTQDRASESVLVDVIGVLDSFSMAFSDKQAWEKVDANWREGVEHIHNQLLSVLKSHGLEEMNPVGEEFDPERHEASEMIPTDEEDKDGIIESVVRKGYTRHDNVIRPAAVRVYEHNQ